MLVRVRMGVCACVRLYVDEHARKCKCLGGGSGQERCAVINQVVDAPNWTVSAYLPESIFPEEDRNE